MSVQAINSHQNLFQYTSFSKTKEKDSFLPKMSDKMHFILSLIANGKKQKKKNNNDNFPEDKYWRCLKCNSMNLKSVWRCAYCGTRR